MNPRQETRALVWRIVNLGMRPSELAGEIAVSISDMGKMLLGELGGTDAQRAKLRALAVLMRAPGRVTGQHERAGPS